MTQTKDYSPGPIDAKGCFTGEFGLGDSLPIDEAPYVIERDRINEGKLQGFGRKLLPMKMEPSTGERTAGGYYLLDTLADAKYMFDWYQDPVDGYVLDGIPILQRSYFLNPVAHYWHVIGAHDFKGIDTSQKIVRFERWTGKANNIEDVLSKEWSDIRDEAESKDLSAVWLMFNPEQEETVAIVSVSEGLDKNGEEPDFDGIERLAGLPSLGSGLEKAAAITKSFERTSWIFSIWFPYSGVGSKKTLWPNSPPFPGI